MIPQEQRNNRHALVFISKYFISRHFFILIAVVKMRGENLQMFHIQGIWNILVASIM